MAENYSENFLRGLVAPGNVDRLTKLLSERKFSEKELMILRDQVLEVLGSGINPPILIILKNEIISQLYSKSE